MNNHNPTPLKDLSAFLDRKTYIEDDGSLRTQIVQKDTPELPINDPDNLLDEDDKA